MRALVEALCLCVAMVVAAAAGASAIEACSASQLAAIEADDKVALAGTGLVCDVAAAQPEGQPWTDFVCAAAEATEQVIAQIPVPEASAIEAGAPPATVLSGQVLVHVPAANVTGFLEAHRRRAHPADAGPG